MTAQKRGLVKFTRTQEAAKADKQSKWDLIGAIADDAIEAGLTISGADSCLAARSALLAAGNEYADKTVKNYCFLAKYDYEATAAQRRVIRGFNTSVVLEFANAGWSQEAATDWLRANPKATVAEARRKAARPKSSGPDIGTESLSEALSRWINRLDALLTEGAELAERAESEGNDLGAHAELALLIYDRITEKKIDAELRSLMEQEDARS